MSESWLTRASERPVEHPVPKAEGVTLSNSVDPLSSDFETAGSVGWATCESNASDAEPQHFGQTRQTRGMTKRGEGVAPPELWPTGRKAAGDGGGDVRQAQGSSGENSSEVRGVSKPKPRALRLMPERTERKTSLRNRRRVGRMRLPRSDWTGRCPTGTSECLSLIHI